MSLLFLTVVSLWCFRPAESDASCSFSRLAKPALRRKPAVLCSVFWGVEFSCNSDNRTPCATSSRLCGCGCQCQSLTDVVSRRSVTRTVPIKRLNRSWRSLQQLSLLDAAEKPQSLTTTFHKRSIINKMTHVKLKSQH